MKKVEKDAQSNEDREVLLPEYCLVKLEFSSQPEKGPSYVIIDGFGIEIPVSTPRLKERMRLRHMASIRIPKGVNATVDVKELLTSERRNDDPPPPAKTAGNSLIARIRARARAEAGDMREAWEASRYEIEDDDPGYFEEDMLSVAADRARDVAAANPPVSPDPSAAAAGDPDRGADEPDEGGAPASAPRAPRK